MIAEVTSQPQISYQGIGWLLVGLGALAMLANQLDDFFKRRQGKDQEPPNGELHVALEAHTEAIDELRNQFKEQREKRDNEIQDIYERMNTDRAFGEEERRRSSSAIYNKIEQTRVEVESNLNDVKETIRVLPNEIITLLKNTNKI